MRGDVWFTEPGVMGLSMVRGMLDLRDTGWVRVVGSGTDGRVDGWAEDVRWVDSEDHELEDWRTLAVKKLLVPVHRVDFVVLE